MKIDKYNMRLCILHNMNTYCTMYIEYNEYL